MQGKRNTSSEEGKCWKVLLLTVWKETTEFCTWTISFSLIGIRLSTSVMCQIFFFSDQNYFVNQVYFHSFNYFSSLKCVTNKLLTNDYQLPQCFCIAWFGADYPILIDCKLLNLASPPFLHPNPYNLALSGSWSQALKLLLFSYTTVPKFHSVLIRATSGVELHPCGSLRTLIL